MQAGGYYWWGGRPFLGFPFASPFSIFISYTTLTLPITWNKEIGFIAYLNFLHALCLWICTSCINIRDDDWYYSIYVPYIIVTIHYLPYDFYILSCDGLTFWNYYSVSFLWRRCKHGPRFNEAITSNSAERFTNDIRIHNLNAHKLIWWQC